MASKENLLSFLVQKPETDRAAVERLQARFDEVLADIFRPVAEDILERRHSEYMLKGGRGSCKSSTISEIIVRDLSNDPLANALVIRKVGATLRDSVYAQMLWAIDMLGVTEEWDATVSPMEIVNRRTGQRIMFRGLDEPRKIKSIKPKKGYFSCVWFEELEEFAGYGEIRSVMQSAGRGKGARTICLMSFNPPKSANNWVNREAMEEKPERLVHHSCYRDVPAAWLGEKFIADAEALFLRDEKAWRHEYGGEATGEGGAVFDNLVIRKLTAEELLACRSHAMYGLDFGFSSDPSALMSTTFFESPDGARRLYVWGEYYKAGAGFDALERAIKETTVGRASTRVTGGKARKGLKSRGSTAQYAEVWADTEPRTISELASRGCNIAAARKGQKSRQFGMQWLEELDEIIIDPSACPNAAREFSAFEHARNRDGSWRADYQDGNDHTIDAVRYSAWRVIFRSRRTKYCSGKGAR